MLQHLPEPLVYLFWFVTIVVNLFNIQLVRGGMMGGKDWNPKRFTFFAWEGPIVWGISCLFLMYVSWFHSPRLLFMFIYSTIALLLMLFCVWAYRSEGAEERRSKEVA